MDREMEIRAETLRGAPDDDKIDFIASVIRECAWEKAASSGKLAKIWKISTREVNAFHKTASWSIRNRIIADAPNLPFEVVEKIDFVVNSAMKAKKAFLTMEGEVVYADAPDHKAALQGLSKLADILGMNNREKGAPNMITKDQFEGKTLEELLLLATEETKKIIDTTGENLEPNKINENDGSLLVKRQPLSGESAFARGGDVEGRHPGGRPSESPSVDGDPPDDSDEWVF